MSSDHGVLMLREVEQRLRVADHLAGCIEDPRAPNQITHTLADIVRLRLLMIAAGYADGNDAKVFARNSPANVSDVARKWILESVGFMRRAERSRSRPGRQRPRRERRDSRWWKV